MGVESPVKEVTRWGDAVIREEFPCQPLHSTANCSVYLIAPPDIVLALSSHRERDE
jgi:hypothetical protein